MLSKKQLQELEESRMTPKKLRAIAEELADCATDNSMWRKFGYVAGYVLTHVNDDDDDPVTPERLVELGGLVFSNRPWCVSFQGAEFAFSTDGVLREISVAVAGRTWPLELSGWLLPPNMGEVRQLLKRCGAIKEAT